VQRLHDARNQTLVAETVWELVAVGTDEAAEIYRDGTGLAVYLHLLRQPNLMLQPAHRPTPARPPPGPPCSRGATATCWASPRQGFLLPNAIYHLV
jgi:hypothetical protein